MSRARAGVRWSALVAVVLVSIVPFGALAADGASASSASSTPAAAAPAVSSALPEAKPSFAASTPTTCDDDVLAWAARASARTNLELIPADCPRGVVRFHVAGVGCDFEVTTARDIGFRRTPDGAFGVSPIVDVEWEDAPMRMKGALDGLIAALVADPALPVPSGDRVLGGTEGHETGSPSLGRRLKLASLAAVALLALVAVIYRLARRRRIARGSSATPDA